MRRTLVTLGVFGLVSSGVVACNDTPGISNATLGFTIEEGLLLLSESDPTVGVVVLAENPGNCPLLQSGAFFTQILSSDFLTFQLQAQDAGISEFLPLTAGTYSIVMPPAPSGAGLYATSTEYETDDGCDFSNTGANSGTVTVQPFAVDAGGISTVSYSVVYGNFRYTGADTLTTCVVPATATAADAGTCLVPGFL